MTLHKSNTKLLLIFCLIANSMHGMELSRFTKRQEKKLTQTFLDTMLSLTFPKIKTTFKRLPENVQLKVLYSCGDAKPLIFLSMMNQETRDEVISQLLDFDKKSIELFYLFSIADALNLYATKCQEAQRYPISSISMGTRLRMPTDCGKIISNATLGYCIPLEQYKILLKIIDPTLLTETPLAPCPCVIAPSYKELLQNTNTVQQVLQYNWIQQFFYPLLFNSPLPKMIAGIVLGNYVMPNHPSGISNSFLLMSGASASFIMSAFAIMTPLINEYYDARKQTTFAEIGHSIIEQRK